MRANEFIIEYRRNTMVGGIDLSFEYDDKFGESAKVQAFSNGRKLGYAEFLVVGDNKLEATDLEVDERYRGQGIARLMYDFVKQQGYKIHRSGAQTMDGHAFWNKNRGEDERVWEDELSEISRDRLERYLSRAGRQVDSRQERMARARQRLNTSYEIYHADQPTKIVDRFEADTPADAQRYYQDYIERYESDRDYDLRLRRGTGIMEGLPPMGFNKNPNKHDPIKNPLRTFVEIANMLGITHKQLVGLQRNYPGFPDPFPGIGKQIGRGRNNYYALNQVKQWLNNNNIDEKIKAWSDNTLDPNQHIAEFAPSPDRDDNDDVPDPVFVLANRWWNAAEKQPQIESVLNSMGWSIQQVESEDDAVQLQHRDGTSYFISADDFDPDVFEDVDQAQPGVYLDMDGVLADFMAGYNRVAGTNYKPGQQLPHPSEDPTLKKITGTNFFSTLPKFASADALVRMVVDQYGHYNICSSPLRGDHENSAANKRAWLNANLQPQPREIVITARKEKHAVQPDGTPNILVDDKPENIERWNAAGGHGILYNAAVDGLDTVAKGLQLNENFADGKKPGRKGLSRRVGIPKKATLAQLQKIASSSTGERRRMAQWQLNMRRGKAKKNK